MINRDYFCVGLNMFYGKILLTYAFKLDFDIKVRSHCIFQSVSIYENFVSGFTSFPSSLWYYKRLSKKTERRNREFSQPGLL